MGKKKGGSPFTFKKTATGRTVVEAAPGVGESITTQVRDNKGNPFNIEFSTDPQKRATQIEAGIHLADHMMSKAGTKEAQYRAAAWKAKLIGLQTDTMRELRQSQARQQRDDAMPLIIQQLEDAIPDVYSPEEKKAIIAGMKTEIQSALDGNTRADHLLSRDEVQSVTTQALSSLMSRLSSDPRYVKHKATLVGSGESAQRIARAAGEIAGVDILDIASEQEDEREAKSISSKVIAQGQAQTEVELDSVAKRLENAESIVAGSELSGRAEGASQVARAREIAGATGQSVMDSMFPPRRSEVTQTHISDAKDPEKSKGFVDEMRKVYGNENLSTEEKHKRARALYKDSFGKEADIQTVHAIYFSLANGS